MIHTGLRPREEMNDVSSEISASEEQPGSTMAHERESSQTTLQRVWKLLKVKSCMCIIQKIS